MALVHGAHPALLRAVMDINHDQRRQVVHKLREVLGSLREQTIGLMGLAFKPNTDDMREAPATDIARMLLHEGAQVRGYDPVAMEVAARMLPEIALAADPYQMATGADALILCTEWNEFKNLDFVRMRELMRHPVLIDGRNLYDPEQMIALGFIYRGMGRGYSVPEG
jgi:UDPglucose 6-dehydrogenase